MLSTCKKRPDAIIIKVIDPLFDKPIPNAKVGLIEQDINGGLFTGGYTCKTIKQGVSDAFGNVTFEGVKLKTNKSNNYFLVVLNAYDEDLFFSCSNRKADDFIPKTRKVINKTVFAHADYIDWQLKINKLNSGGFSNLNTDSISVTLHRDFAYYFDFDDLDLNGSKKNLGTISLNKASYQILTNPSNPDDYTCCPYNYLSKIYPGRYKVIVTKNKGGILSTSTHYENVSPFTSKYYFNIDW
jgi:hypothetical protein